MLFILHTVPVAICADSKLVKYSVLFLVHVIVWLAGNSKQKNTLFSYVLACKCVR